ncbi:hypothetical protein L195_g061668 [Trifolium pratense]|uniref:Uncharacterized protein n=1 Tax=Trifolium pratense TaxID=57577 RepID=A0A2K3KB43_TRIPR|nr:hypothetical protein L195_g061668 [Trifolium pratense]
MNSSSISPNSLAIYQSQSNPFSSRVHRSIEPIHQSCSISECAAQSTSCDSLALTESAVSRKEGRSLQGSYAP